MGRPVAPRAGGGHTELTGENGGQRLALGGQCLAARAAHPFRLFPAVEVQESVAKPDWAPISTALEKFPRPQRRHPGLVHVFEQRRPMGIPVSQRLHLKPHEVAAVLAERHAHQVNGLTTYAVLVRTALVFDLHQCPAIGHPLAWVFSALFPAWKMTCPVNQSLNTRAPSQ